MSKCILCEGQTSWLGDCKNCGLANKISKIKNDHYLLFFSGGRKFNLPLENNLELIDYVKKNKNKLLDMLKEDEIASKEEKIVSKEDQMASIGYYKGKMCPFTQVKIGGTRTATLAFTGASMNEFTWTHTECIEEYCAIWNDKDKQCSMKLIENK